MSRSDRTEDDVEAFEPTPAEMKLANRLGLAMSVAFPLVLIAYNVTGSWLFMVIYLVAMTIALVGTTAWAARTRHTSLWRVTRAILRQPRRG